MMARYTLGYSDLYDEVSWFLGLTTRGTSPSSTNLTTCKSLVDRGIRQFMYPLDDRGRPYEWKFLQQFTQFNVISGKMKYALPIDFSEIGNKIYYDNNSANPPIVKRDAKQILNMITGNDQTGYPEYFAISPTTYDPITGTLYELWFYPKPNQIYTLSAFYRADPIKLSATTDLIFGGIRAIEAILECCLAVAEHSLDDMKTSHHAQKARELIMTLIKFDRITDSGKLGNLYRNEEIWPPDRSYFTYPDIENNVYP